MPSRTLAYAAAIGLAVGGCASGASAGTGSVSGLRSSFAEDRAAVNAIVSDLTSTVAQAGPSPDALLANGFRSLAARAETEAGAIDDLNPPSRFNTHVRDLGSALNAVANGLGHLSQAATQHDGAGARAAVRALRDDATQVRITEANLAGLLGLRSH